MRMAIHNCGQSYGYLSAVVMTLLNAQQPRTGLLLPFVAMCCPAIEVAFAAWQVRVYVWPSPTVSDLHVLDLAEAAISVMAIISQRRMLSSCGLLFLSAPLLFFTLSASSYCIIGVIKRLPGEEDL